VKKIVEWTVQAVRSVSKYILGLLEIESSSKDWSLTGSKRNKR